MAASEDKNKVKITPLISDTDRKFGVPRTEVQLSQAHIPTKEEIRKKSLDDMLKRIRDRG